MSDHRKAPLPRYRELAHQLAAGIASGRYPLNSVLPGEIELAQTYSLSRHTAREAMKILEQDGLISRKRRVGSVVVAQRPLQRYHQHVQTADDLLQYRLASKLTVTEIERVVLDGMAAQQLAVESGTPGVRLTGLRFRPESDRPFAYSEIYLPASSARVRLPARERAMAFLAKRLDAEHLKAVEQTMSAEEASNDLAAKLQVDAGSATFKTIRVYIDANDRPAVAAFSWHPGDSYVYSTRLTRSL